MKIFFSDGFLNQQIDHYLPDWQMPPGLNAPLTVSHLMTHTGGFSERLFGLFFTNPDLKKSLDNYINEEAVPVIREPGTTLSYSNYGVSLAGKIVECASGQKFEDYIESHILMPLSMSNSTFEQHPEKVYLRGNVRGYQYYFGSYKEYKPEYTNQVPAAGLQSTANDISAFMTAHLNNGLFNGNRILKEKTMALMHERLYNSPNGTLSWAHGLVESEMNGKRILSHFGATLFFHSVLLILPDEGIGIFVTTNSTSGKLLHQDFLKLFFNHYFPVNPPFKTYPKGVPLEYKKYWGFYRPLRHSKKGFEKILQLLNLSFVSTFADYLIFIQPFKADVYGLDSSDAPIFGHLENEDKNLGFQESLSDGKIYLFNSQNRYDSYEKIGLLEAAPLHGIFLILYCIGLFFRGLSTLSASLKRLFTVNFRILKPHQNFLLNYSDILLNGIVLFNFIFLVLTAVSLIDPYQFFLELPPTFYLGQWAIFLSFLCLISSLFVTLISFFLGKFTLKDSLKALRKHLMPILFIWILGYWNLFGFHL